ncbi:hypothetical protein AGR7B_Cc140128 [Agrobacterium deltaense RV3]|nr:hypothetical protein AGR7B_Cc140128 [Agrobacterium deltaense RV3]
MCLPSSFVRVLKRRIDFQPDALKRASLAQIGAKIKAGAEKAWLHPAGKTRLIAPP